MKNILLCQAFANANAASKMYICATAQNVEIVQADFEALDWVEIKSIGSRGETGKKTNMLSFNTWDTAVIQKAKGMTDAGSPQLEVARIPTDPGQVLLRTAGAVGNNNNYAFREVRADGIDGGTGTIKYNRGLVGGPTSPGGRNEDFDLEMFTLAFQQEEIVVDPVISGVPPELTVAPAITGTAQTGQTLTLSSGTFTGDATIVYARTWYRGGVAIAGATGGTYVVVSADEGHVISGRVTGTNSSGSATGFAPPTSAVIP